MPETASRLPEEDRPKLGLDAVRKQEGAGGATSSAGTVTGGGSGTGSGTGSRSGGTTSTSGNLGGSGGGSATSSAGTLHSDSGSDAIAPSDLEDREAESGLFNEEDDGNSKRWRLKMLKKHKKKAAFLGGLGGMSIVSIIMFSSVAQGPLEFIHLAQLLEKFQFSNLEDAQDSRLMKIARYIHDPTKPQNTRLGIVGNLAADHLEGKLNDATGLKSEYDPLTGEFKGYSVISDNERWQGKSDEQIKTELAESYGLDESTFTTFNDGEKSVPGFNPDPGGWNPIKRYRAQTSFSRGQLGEAGYSKLSSYIGTRVLGERAGWTFHPIKALDASAKNTVLKAGKKGLDKLRDKINTDEASYEANGDTSTPGGEPSAEETKDSDGNPQKDPQAEAESQGAEDLDNERQQIDPTDESTKQSFSDHMSVKIASGGAALIGVACVVRNLSSSIGGERMDKVMLPMMRKAGKFISLGSQAQSGVDIDTLQLGIYKNNYLDTMNDKGQVTSTWDTARSIQAENGDPMTGPDLPQSDQVFTSSNPFSFFDNIPALGAACGALNSTFGQIFSVVTGPVSYVVSTAVMSQVMPALADWLSGSPLNPVASGAEFGNIVNYGARLSANDQAASDGGVPMDGSDELALKNINSKLDQKDFQSKSFAYRLLNPDDSQTLVAQLIDRQDLNLPSGMANLAGGFASIFKTAFKAPATLLSGTAHAADATYDYHGLKSVGFTASELGDPRFDDPFANACHVVGCPDAKPNPITGIFDDSSKAQKYTDLAQRCFGVNITNNGGNWGIDSKTKAVNIEDKSYPTDQCKSQDLDWLRVRFWLLDTPTMEGYACSQDLDQQSCQDLGLGSDGSDASGSAGASAPTSAAGATIDMAHIDDDSTGVACAPGTNDDGTANGYTDNNLVKVRLCEIPNFPCTCNGYANKDGHVVMNSRVSGAVLALVTAAKKDHISMSADNTFRTMAQQQVLWVRYGEDPNRVASPGTSNHQMGLAIDFNGVGDSPAPGTGPIWDWLDKNASNFGYKNYPKEAWHWSPTGN